MQTNKSSMYESIVQTLSGVILGFMIQKFVFPHIGIHITNEQNLKAVIIFFFASLFRQYVIRRMFNINLKEKMKLSLRIIKEYFWAIKILLSKKNLEHFDYDFTMKFIKKVKKEIKSEFYKRVITCVLKKHRPKYFIEDFSKAKNLYEEFQKNNSIKSIYQVNPGDYLYIIDVDYPIKGKEFASYYINSHYFTDRIFKVADIDIKNQTVGSEKNEFYRAVQQCRFATPEEIKSKEEEDLEKELWKAINKLPRRNFK